MYHVTAWPRTSDSYQPACPRGRIGAKLSGRTCRLMEIAYFGSETRVERVVAFPLNISVLLAPAIAIVLYRLWE